MGINESVAAEIRAELARQQMSGSKAARQLGWTQNYIATRLRGEVSWSLPDLEAIARLLEVSVMNFFDRPPGAGDDSGGRQRYAYHDGRSGPADWWLAA